MALNPLISLQGQGSDVGRAVNNALLNVSNINSIQQAEQDRKTQAARQAALDGLIGGIPGATPGINPVANMSPQKMAELAVRFPEEFEKIREGLGFISDQQKAEASEFAFRVQRLPYGQREQMIRDRVEVLRRQERDPRDTESLLGKDQAAQDFDLQTTQLALLSPEQRVEVMKGRDLKVYAPEVDPDTGEIFFPGYDPAADKGLRIAVPGAKGQTPAEKAQQEISIARQKSDIEAQGKERQAAGKFKAKREHEDIDAGYAASQAVPNLKRSIDLLGEIKTGGINAVSLKAKQFFGIEGADEAELINAMNKQVIAQLRPVFGAQFTKAEGDWLKAIEASERKSTAGNIRLLERGLKLATKRAEIGKKAALQAGDYRRAQDMQDFLNSDLTPQGQQNEPSAAAASKPASGQKRLRFDASGNLIQ